MRESSSPTPAPTAAATGLRVLHVAATANGAQWMVDQLRELRARGHDVSAVISGEQGTLAPALAAERIPYHVLDLDILTHRRLSTAASRVIALARLLRRVRPDVVQYHLYPSVVIGRLAAWLADVPVRFSMIASPYHLEAPILGAIDAGTAWADTKVIASCAHTRTLYARQSVPRDRVELIYYGPDARRFDPARADGARVRRELGLAPTTPTVGLVAWFYPPREGGRFTPPSLIGRGQKGHDVLLRAVPHVLARVPDAVFLLVGAGWGRDGTAYVAQLQALAAELGIAHAVRFTGARADVPDTLAACDVSVQCSLIDNLGGTLESLLMARPMVATAVGGFVDSVRHDQTGLLVPPDRPDALADAIVRLLVDRPLATRLASQGRALALERFTLRTTADALNTLYRTHAAAQRSGAGATPHANGFRVHRTCGRALILPFRAAALLVRLLRTRGERRIAATADAAVPARVFHIAAAQHAQWLVSICRELRARGYDAQAIIGDPDGELAAAMRAANVPYRALRLTAAEPNPPRAARAAHASDSADATDDGARHAARAARAARDRREPKGAASRSGSRFLLRRMSRPIAQAIHLPVAVWRLARFLRREHVAIVHTHIFHSILIGRIAAWIARVPYRVAMVPGPLHLEAPVTRWADRLTWWMDHRVIAGSEWTRDRYRTLGLRTPRLACISYGADAARFDPARADATRIRRELAIPSDVPLIGLIAWFYPPRDDWQTPPFMRGRGLKGHEDLLAAARLVLRERPAARFLLVGGGSNAAGERYRHELIARCRADRMLADAVIFTGPRGDVADVLAGLDVAVQCSLSENYGGTIEALLMERPTVATRVGGMPETVRHGETGVLVPPADPDALAAAILRLLADPAAAREMARAGRRLMLERFQIAHTAASIAALYEQLRDPSASASAESERAVAAPPEREGAL